MIRLQNESTACQHRGDGRSLPVCDVMTTRSDANAPLAIVDGQREQVKSDRNDRNKRVSPSDASEGVVPRVRERISVASEPLPLSEASVTQFGPRATVRTRRPR
jgi:hypothetical protein